jgi:biotin operon repressor
MDYFTYEERLIYLLELVEKGRLLSLKQIADKFNCSISTVERMLRHLKAKGHQIKYSNSLRKFYIKK